MLNIRQRNFILDAHEKLDELGYGANCCSNFAGLTREEEAFFSWLSKQFDYLNDQMMMRYEVLKMKKEA